jgi:hypothetical protein
MNHKTLNLEASPVRRSGVLKQGPAGHFILFNSHDACYFGLDEIGSLVWDLCDGAHSFAEIIARLCEEYEAPQDTVETDLSDLMVELDKRNLLASSDLFKSETTATALILREEVQVTEILNNGVIVERVGTSKLSGKPSFRSRFTPEGKESERIYYDDRGEVSKIAKYQYDEARGYKVMELFNPAGQILLRHERGNPPQQFK